MPFDLEIIQVKKNMFYNYKMLPFIFTDSEYQLSKTNSYVQ